MAATRARRARFEAVALALPGWGAARPQRCVYLGGVQGSTQLFLWDLERGTVRQMTEEPHGVSHGCLDPGAATLWWFALDASGETGRWTTARLAGSAPADALPELPSGHPEGLALAANGTAAAAISRHRGGTTVCIRSAAGTVTTHQYDYPVYIGGITSDGERTLLVHAEHGDPRRPALRVLRADGSVLAGLDHWPAGGVDVTPYSAPFHPADGRVLATQDRDGRREPLLWDPDSGAVEVVETGLAGDIEARRTPDGDALLLHRRRDGRSELFLMAPDAAPQRLDIPTGTVHGAAARPDGDVWCLHSSRERPPTFLSMRDGALLTAAAQVPASHPVRDFRVSGPGGPVHVFLTEPHDTAQPMPCIFLLHGGPAYDDGDEYRPDVEAWADAGYAVACVNYRGSSGYGTAWRRANQASVGHTELEDVIAVREHLVGSGIADPDRCVLAGGSWGGFLALLGVGVYPELWACAIAESPVADFATAYEDRIEELRAVDRALFGGGPREQPERYRAASPMSYVDRVTAPVMIVYGGLDPRCPPRQIEAYIRALRDSGGTVAAVRHDGGHGTREAAGVADQLAMQLDFAAESMASRARAART